MCYIFQGEKDWKKYEMARQLHKHADRIRADYREDFKSKEMRIRQRSVAMYFIDKVRSVAMYFIISQSVRWYYGFSIADA